MKYFFIAAATASLLWACNSNDAQGNSATTDSLNRAQQMNAAQDSANYTAIQWIDSTYQDIGKVKQGQVAEVTWRLKNVGTKPLIIIDVMPGCGCTVADKPKEPIAPGQESVIKAKFESAGQHEGEHQKHLSVQANTSGTTTHQLVFRTEVVK